MGKARVPYNPVPALPGCADFEFGAPGRLGAFGLRVSV